MVYWSFAGTGAEEVLEIALESTWRRSKDKRLSIIKRIWACHLMKHWVKQEKNNPVD